ncbi:recombinase family protein [Reyranella sp.]|uniref:recombinase family protein n=1 Tax=Reyranella sp. TaxID=1929291 RepID=UPI0027318E4F|nr:recombinase family protein [Reyranella sp.]MDP2373997.1 recombinase family protein [Reyranella sp.]
MTRVALYARYSSDNQSVTSIDDQFRICREHAAGEKWKIVGTYHDAAISGASVILRPGVQALLQDAQRGVFDTVLAEALDRVSRDQADVATLFKHLRFAGVQIVTLSEGEISELHVGLNGTMNALFLKDLAAKTHRGIRGRVEKGKSGGGLCYGYDVVGHTSAEGEPIRGERAINLIEAEIIRRVFRAFAAGISPRAIARHLNDEGIPGPVGALWTDSTLRGHAARGTGLINNELYIGKLVWNRLRYIKDPTTGKRVSRINPREKWITTEVPELRIVDDALWQAAKARQGELAIKYANVIVATRSAHANRLNGTHRPRSLLSGLLVCGHCGGPYALRGQDRYACSNHVMNGSCANSRSITREALEARMLDGLRDRLMAPEIAAEAMRAYAEETNRLNRERRSSGAADRKALADIDKKLKEIVTAIEDGGYSRPLMARLRDLEAKQDELTERLSRAPVDIPDIHPNVAGIYRRKVERLAEALQHPQERAEAADAIRGLIERITLTPGPKRGQIDATLHGDLGTILEWAAHASQKNKTDIPSSGMSASVVAGARNHL